MKRIRVPLSYPASRGFDGESQAACRGGSFAVESVAAFAWNGWQASSGISGNLGLEYASSVCRRVGGLEKNEAELHELWPVCRRVGGLEIDDGVVRVYPDVCRRVGGLENPGFSQPRSLRVCRRVGGLEIPLSFCLMMSL